MVAASHQIDAITSYVKVELCLKVFEAVLDVTLTSLSCKKIESPHLFRNWQPDLRLLPGFPLGSWGFDFLFETASLI